MIKLILLPQRNDMEVKYSIENEVFKVEIDNEIDSFDFSILEHGDIGSAFVTSLPYSTVLNVECTDSVNDEGDINRELVIHAIGWYGPDDPESYHEVREVYL